MTTHTPGPWLRNAENDYHIVDSEGYTIADIARAKDARLIAAAPALMEALKACLEDINTIIENDVLSNKAASPDDHPLASAHRLAWCALAQAEGREP